MDGKVKFKFQKGDSKAGITQSAETQQTQQQTAAKTQGQQQASSLPPNRILLIQNLPKEANESMVSMLFSGTTGFQKVSLIPGFSGYAYVEYKDIPAAQSAMTSLQGFK